MRYIVTVAFLSWGCAYSGINGFLFYLFFGYNSHCNEWIVVGFKSQGTLLSTGPSTPRPCPIPGNEKKQNCLNIAQSGIGKISCSSKLIFDYSFLARQMSAFNLHWSGHLRSLSLLNLSIPVHWMRFSFSVGSL
jgi:hypothetical protein